MAESTVWAWCRSGRLPAVQHAGRWYVLTDD
ncbi:helix-turn-helix domain-containing protein [Streptomyces sp. NRRL S-340]|nr:helix-turn-helix domain-containing protein [Streptomyces sp. NRRL S-340]